MSAEKLKEEVFELIAKTHNGITADDLWEYFRGKSSVLEIDLAINELQEENRIIIHPKRFEAKI